MNGPPYLIPDQGIASNTSKKGDSLATSALKEQLALLALLVAFCGIEYIEAYYGAFGVKFQYLSLSTTYTIFRGLTVIYEDWPILIVYAVAVGWFVLDSVASREGWPRFLTIRYGGSHMLIFVLLILVYLLARSAGLKRADKDLEAETTTLPLVSRMRIGNEREITSVDGYRVLLLSSENIIVFKPRRRSERTSVSPHMVSFMKGEIRELELDPTPPNPLR